MAERLDAMVVREKDGKSYWTKVGAAFPSRNGGWLVRLDALPVNGELHLMVPRAPREEAPKPAAAPDPYAVDPTDEPPF